MTELRFTTTLAPRPRGGVLVELPFDPNEAWGEKERHYVTGSIGAHRFRGVLTTTGGRNELQLGPAWCRDPRVGPGARVAVALRPEGPQLGSMAPDIAEAIRAAPAARRYFESLATFYRKGFVDWIEAARGPETRASRIAATLASLEAKRNGR